MFVMLGLPSTLLDPLLQWPSTMSDPLIVSGLALLVEPLSISVPLLDPLLISPSDPPMDGDGASFRRFNGDGSNFDPDDGVVVFDVFNDVSLVDDDGTTDDCLPTAFFFFFFCYIHVTPTCLLLLSSCVCFLSNLFPLGVSIVLPIVLLVAPCAIIFYFFIFNKG